MLTSSSSSSRTAADLVPLLLSRMKSSIAYLETSFLHSLSQLYLFITCQLIIHPDAPLKYCWDWFLLLSILYNILALPFVISFIPAIASSTFGLTMDVTTTLLMTADMLITLRTAVMDHSHTLVYDTPTIVRRYVRSTPFYLDLFSTFPFFLASFAINSSSYPLFTINILKLPSVLRVSRMFRSPRVAEATSTPKLRIVRFLVWFMYLAHVFACGWFFIGGQQPNGANDSWIVRKNFQSASVIVQYIDSLYWALETMCTCGYGDNLPTTPYEQAYCCFVLMATGVVYAAVFGNMTNAIQALSTSTRRHHRTLDDVHEFSDIYTLPLPLHSKLLNYAQQHWNHTKGFEIGEVINPLPQSVRAEVLSHINSTLIRRVPLFQHSQQRFVDAIILKLHNLVCLPGDYVFREGDMSRDMYFIKHGRVEVIMDDPTAIGEQEVVIAELGAESAYPFFGEVALLLGETRTATVRAKEPTMLSMISMSDFYDVMAMFSHEEDTLREVAMSRLRGDLERMRAKDEAGVREEKAQVLAILALDTMKKKALKFLSHLEAEQRQRNFRRQHHALMETGNLRGVMRFKRAVLGVIDRIVEGKKPLRKSPVVGPAPDAASLALLSHPPPTLHLAPPTAVVVSPTAASASSPNVLSPLHNTPLRRQPTHPSSSRVDQPSRTDSGTGAASARVRQYRSDVMSPTSSGPITRQSSFNGFSRKESLIGDRQAMSTLLRSSTLRELKHLVIERDSAAGEGEAGLGPMHGKTPSHSTPHSHHGSDTSTPVSRGSRSDIPKTDLLFLLNGQGSGRDVLAMNLLTVNASPLRATSWGQRRDSREPSRPGSSGDGAQRQAAFNFPLRTLSTRGEGGEGMIANRGAMLEKLLATRGRTLISPSGALYRPSGQSGYRSAEGATSESVPTVVAPITFPPPLPLVAGAQSPSTLTSPTSGGRGLSGQTSPSQDLLSPVSMDASPTSPTSRSIKRRTMNLAAQLKGPLEGLGGVVGGGQGGVGGSLSARARGGEDEELAALKRARDDKIVQLQKRRTLREGGLAGLLKEAGDQLGSAAGQGGGEGGGSPVVGTSDRRTTSQRGFTLRSSAPVAPAAVDGPAVAGAAVTP